MCEGFNVRFKRDAAKHLDTLRVVRWAGWMQYAVNRDPKKRMIPPEELLPFDETTEKNKLDLPTKEEMEEIKKGFN